MNRFLRTVPTLMLLLVGATSFLMSYVAIRDMSARLGAVPESLAWAVPVCVDGGILAGSAAIWAGSTQRKRRDPLAFLTVAVLLGTSVVINVSHAGDDPLAKWIAALPPLILLACLEIVAASHRHALTLEEAPAEAEVAAPVETPVVSVEQVVAASAGPAAVPVLASEPVLTPDTNARPELTWAKPQPEPVVEQPVGRHALEPVVASTAASTEARPSAPKKMSPSTAKRTERRVTAAAPGEATAGDRIRALFDAHIAEGGDPADPKLAGSIAAATENSVQYVRRVLKPMREQAQTT